MGGHRPPEGEPRPACGPSGPRASLGFTLIELVLVISLSAILAVGALSMWPDESVGLAAQARQVANDIRYTQAMAMMRGKRYRINFASDRYWLSLRDGSGIPHPASGQVNVPLDSGTTLSSNHAYLVFDEDGAPYVSAALPGTALTADAVITLSSGGASQQVRVSPETGRVLVP